MRADHYRFDSHTSSDTDTPIRPELGLLADEPAEQPIAQIPRANPLGAIVVILLAIAWLAMSLWFVASDVASLTPMAAIQLIAALASVPALIALGWLLTQRTSRVEALRFGATAAAMRAQSAALEDSLAALTHTLQANQALIADQAEQLARLGDGASERLALLSHALAGEMQDATEHTHRLSDTAASARANVEVLLTSLPRARAEADDFIERMARTGLIATEQAAALDAQLAALAERSTQAEAAAGTAAARLAAHIVRMEATSETAGARLEGVTATMSDAVDALLGRTADAVDRSRQGIAAQGEAMLAMVRANQATLDGAARESTDALASRIGSVEATIRQIGSRLEEQRRAADSFVTNLETGVGRVDGRLAALQDHGLDRIQRLDEALIALSGSAQTMVQAIAAGDTVASQTIHTTENLLIALDAAAREIDETLPMALARLDAHVGESKAGIGRITPEMLALVDHAESTHAVIETTTGTLAAQRESASTLAATLAEARQLADELGMTMSGTVTNAQRFANEAAPRLVEALLRVRETAAVAAERARETLTAVIPEAAKSLEDASIEAMRRAALVGVDRQIAAINDAATQAVAAAASATERLAEQVHAVAEQTAIVETRFDDARVERDAADTDALSGRVGRLIEALNAASIDIAKALAPDVADTAWAAYLKGDHGVFTRRAVRILDSGQSRGVVRLYDDDSGFREQVNRYIHDFEAMLRTILNQRDGAPLSVTILSSDMGKLYVALAQAIKRLH